MIIKLEIFIHNSFFPHFFRFNIVRRVCAIFSIQMCIGGKFTRIAHTHTHTKSVCSYKLNCIRLTQAIICVGFQRSAIRNAQCISTENSIKFGIDQSISRWLSFGYIGVVAASLTVCMCVHCTCSTLFPVNRPSERVNFSRKISAFATSKLFHIWHFFLFFCRVIFFSSPFTFLAHCYCCSIGVFRTREIFELCQKENGQKNASKCDDKRSKHEQR